MRINLGSTNPTKIAAVKKAIQDYDFLANAQVIGFEVKSGVSEQPTSLQETIEGATNRAVKVFRDCAYSIGLESGLMEVPKARTGYMDVCACAIHDGKNIYLGLSPAFECPPSIIKIVKEKGLDLNEATCQIGLTDNPKVGSAEGLMGILTKGKVTREEATILAIRTALIALQNPDLYS